MLPQRIHPSLLAFPSNSKFNPKFSFRSSGRPSKAFFTGLQLFFPFLNLFFNYFFFVSFVFFSLSFLDLDIKIHFVWGYYFCLNGQPSKNFFVSSECFLFLSFLLSLFFPLYVFSLSPFHFHFPSPTIILSSSFISSSSATVQVRPIFFFSPLAFYPILSML